MNNPWRLYDELIAGIPQAPTVKYFQTVQTWNMVISSENSIGLAAINSWYNHPERAGSCGYDHPKMMPNESRDAFDVYSEEVKGKKVAVIGHFPSIEKRYGNGHCQLSILERSPSDGDYPDPACEYLLPEQDYVFITGCTLVNKTFPRLLELSARSKVIVVGPSTPLTPLLFKQEVYGLSGFISADADQTKAALNGDNQMNFFKTGVMTDRIAGRPDSNEAGCK